MTGADDGLGAGGLAAMCVGYIFGAASTTSFVNTIFQHERRVFTPSCMVSSVPTLVVHDAQYLNLIAHVCCRDYHHGGFMRVWSGHFI